MNKPLFKAGSIVTLTDEAAHNCPTYAGKRGVVRWKMDQHSTSNQIVYNVTYGPDDDVFINERLLKTGE